MKYIPSNPASKTPLSSATDTRCSFVNRESNGFPAGVASIEPICTRNAAIFGLTDFLANPLIRAQPPAWLHFIGNVGVLILATLNMVVHSRDAWTSVVPLGLTLSALVVALLLFTSWLGWSMVYRHGVGVAR